MASAIDLLDRDWVHIGPSRATAARFPDTLALVGADTLDAVVEREPDLPRDTSDRLHSGIVARAVAGDRLASRLELQLLLPAARSLAARFWGLGDSDERGSAAVAAIYRAIHAYPVERRPRYVAGNIIAAAADALRTEAKRTHQRASRADIPIDALADMTAVDGRHAADELAELLIEAVTDGRLSSVDARVIAQTRIEGRRLADIAAAAGCTLRSLQRRRHAAEHALAMTGVAA